jgi:hypothetical protein
MKPTTQELLEEVLAFLSTHGMSETAFGIQCANDGHLVADLRSGVDMRSSRRDRIRKFIGEYQGKGRRRPRSNSTCQAA